MSWLHSLSQNPGSGKLRYEPNAILCSQAKAASLWPKVVLWSLAVVVQSSRRVFSPARVATWRAFEVPWECESPSPIPTGHRRAARNLQKQGVSFEEAASVFRDDLSITVPDPDHSMEEERFITVGVSSQNRLLMVTHTDQGDLIRIISARELTPRERRQYSGKRGSAVGDEAGADSASRWTEHGRKLSCLLC